MIAEDEFNVSIQVSDASEAAEVEGWLKEKGVADVKTTGLDEQGILPIIIAVVGTIAAVSALADAIERWRKNHMCQEIIDARDKSNVVIKKDCSIKDGRIVVLSAEGQKVEIHDVPDGIDITKIVEAAVKSGAEAVKAAADAAGAKADGPKAVVASDTSEA